MSLVRLGNQYYFDFGKEVTFFYRKKSSKLVYKTTTDICSFFHFIDVEKKLHRYNFDILKIEFNI